MKKVMKKVIQVETKNTKQKKVMKKIQYQNN